MNKKIILLLIFFNDKIVLLIVNQVLGQKETKIKVEKNSNINEIFKKIKFLKRIKPKS